MAKKLLSVIAFSSDALGSDERALSHCLSQAVEWLNNADQKRIDIHDVNYHFDSEYMYCDVTIYYERTVEDVA